MCWIWCPVTVQNVLLTLFIAWSFICGNLFFFRPCHSSAINLQTFNKGVVVSDCCLTPSERFFFSQLYRGENKCLLCVFTFWVPCCGVSHNFRIKTMFCSSLPLVVCMRAHVLFTLFVLVCMWRVQHILCCGFRFFVLCTLCCYLLWMGYFLLFSNNLHSITWW
jgi:hypothetical protein